MALNRWTCAVCGTPIPYEDVIVVVVKGETYTTCDKHAFRLQELLKL